MQIKKVMCVALCLTMLIGILAGCGSEESPDVPDDGSAATLQSNAKKEIITLSAPLEMEPWQDDSKFDMMDIAYYVSGKLRVDGLEVSENRAVRTFKWEEKDFSVLEDYITLLCEEYDYQRVGEPYYTGGYLSGTLFDIVLRYTGDNPGPGQRHGGIHSENPGDVVFWGKINYGQIEGNIWYDSTITAGDDGYRHGQSERINPHPGPSLSAGLEQHGRIYHTTDGRLSTPPGIALLLTEDESLVEADTLLYDTRYEIDTDNGYFTVYLENEYGDDFLYFYVPSREGWHDGIYSASEFMESGHRFVIFHNGEEIRPEDGLAGEMSGLSLRVMYQDKKTMVFYVCATFRSEPAMIEALIPVNIDVEPISEEKQASADDSGEFCDACEGDGDCKRCDGGRIYWTDDFKRTSKLCDTCFGDNKCEFCNGTGRK